MRVRRRGDERIALRELCGRVEEYDRNALFTYGRRRTHLHLVCACASVVEPERIRRASFSREGPNEELQAKIESEADYKATLELPQLKPVYVLLC